MTGDDEPEAWTKPMAELNVHNRIVGDQFIDWSCDHVVAVATSKKLILCETLTLSNSHKQNEVSYQVKSISLPEQDVEFDAGDPQKLKDFEAACTQSSNLAACPNNDVYKIHTDPCLDKGKRTWYNGFQKVLFGPVAKVYGQRCLMTTLTLDYRCQIWCERTNGMQLNWQLAFDVTKLLCQHLAEQKGRFPHSPSNQSLPEIDAMKLKKFGTWVTCFAWSDTYDLSQSDEQCRSLKFAFLVTASRDGTLVLWRLGLPQTGEQELTLVHSFDSKCCGELAAICCLKQSKLEQTDRMVALSVACSNHDGLIVCHSLQVHANGKCEVLSVKSKSVWKEKDHLAPRNLRWFATGEGHNTLLVGCKSHILVAFELNAELNTIQDTFLQDAHAMPIKRICMNSNNPDLLYSCSSDGNIAQVRLLRSPQLKFALDKYLAISDDSYFRSVSPVMLHGMSLSPNGAFLALVKSAPRVTRSVQAENEGSLTLIRLMSPAQAAEKMIELSGSNSTNVYGHYDLADLVRHHHAMTGGYHPLLAPLVDSPVTDPSSPEVQLRVRWYLMKFKILFEEKRTEGLPESDDQDARNKLKHIEALLIARQMTRALKAWLKQSKSSAADKQLDVIPVALILTWLQSKRHLLTDECASLVDAVKETPAYASLTPVMTCRYTSLPLAIADDGRYCESSDSSRWPICCFTFRALQGPRKRRCRISELFADVITPDKPSWMTDLLTSRCIFSHAPFT